ncbi:hypothetical protein GQ457_18G011510 [Hibiscus cannabinus]
MKSILSNNLLRILHLIRSSSRSPSLALASGILDQPERLKQMQKGGRRVVWKRLYREYRVEDYSKWVQKRVNNESEWINIKSWLADSKVCTHFHNKHLNDGQGAL